MEDLLSEFEDETEVDAADFAEDDRSIMEGGESAVPRPTASAVVIGVGGSGIQTISRIRQATRTNRGDLHAINAVEFLGIDAVPLSGQKPKLAPGAMLGHSEFINITQNPFQPYSFVQGRIQVDPDLSEWWDHRYNVPSTAVTDGLKRERMLGRLAYYRERAQLQQAISSRMDQALAVRAAHRDADQQAKIKIPIYLVSSCAGGTGSSGFLEVVFAIWRAAAAGGWDPEIRAFIYTPSVFREEVVKGLNGLDAANAQMANAFAFFTELDYFLNHGDELRHYFLPAVERMSAPNIPKNGAVKQVYVMENTLRGGGTLRVTDVFDITAEAIYQFLFTESGIALLGSDGTNTDQALEQNDRFKKPRRYCSLGIARVIYPGDTYRRHVDARFLHWITEEALLKPAGLNLGDQVRDSEQLDHLIAAFEKIDSESQDLRLDDGVQDIVRRLGTAPANLRDRPTPETLATYRGIYESNVTFVQSTLQQTSRRQVERLVNDFVQMLEMQVMTTGYGVPWAIEMMRVLQKTLVRELDAARSGETDTAKAVISRQSAVATAVAAFEEASARGFAERVFAQALSKVGGNQRPLPAVAEDLGKKLSAAIDAIVQAQISAGRRTFLERAVDETRKAGRELVRAQQLLQNLAAKSEARWKEDDFKGKDAGPIETTTALPTDVGPEIEASRLSLRVFAEFSRDNAELLSGDALRDLLQEWVSTSGLRGFLSLGSEMQDERSAALRTLRELLGRTSARVARNRLNAEGKIESRLPTSLLEAADGEREELQNGLRRVVALSKGVCWSWEQGLFAIAGVGEAPRVTTVITHPDNLARDIREIAGPDVRTTTSADPERVVALSCEWAVPLHTLNSVRGWQTQYERLRLARRTEPTLAPAHIDARFEAQLDQLIPQIINQDEVAEHIGKALIASRWIRDMAEFDAGPAGRRPAILALGDDDFWVFRSITWVDRRLVVGESAVKLGKSLSEATAALAMDHQALYAIRTLPEAMVRFAMEEDPVGEKQIVKNMIETATDWINTSLVNMRQHADRSEAEVLDRIGDMSARWVSRLVTRNESGA